jgi:Transcriptional regulators
MSKKTPLYYSIMLTLKNDIIDGKYPINSLLPTETELENMFQVSKITIRKAIDLLENDGYVNKKSGKGTIVISNSIFNRFSNGHSFANVMKQQGYQLIKEGTQFEYVTLEPQHELFPYFGRKTLKITRFYYLDGQPYIHLTHYLAGDLELPQINNDEDFSLYMFLYKHNYLISHFNDDFFVEFPSKSILKSLNLENGPVLGRKRMSFDHNNKVVEVSFSRYNTRLHSYQIQYDV